MILTQPFHKAMLQGSQSFLYIFVMLIPLLTIYFEKYNPKERIGIGMQKNCTKMEDTFTSNNMYMIK